MQFQILRMAGGRPIPESEDENEEEKEKDLPLKKAGVTPTTQ
jgi:hypothetical protein